MLTLVRGFDDRLDLDVVMLQQKLQLVVGKDCVAVDGVYGPRTTQAVAQFMRQKGLSPPELSGDDDGGAGQLTPQADALLRDSFLSELEKRALQKAESVSGSIDLKDTRLVEGHVALDSTRVLQLSLNQVLGRQFVKPDGVYGPKTRAAIETFQQMYGLPLDGDVGEQLATVRMTLRAVAEDARATRRNSSGGKPDPQT